MADIVSKEILREACISRAEELIRELITTQEDVEIGSVSSRSIRGFAEALSCFSSEPLSREHFHWLIRNNIAICNGLVGLFDEGRRAGPISNGKVRP